MEPQRNIMTPESDLDSDFESLSFLLQVACPACGARNALRATTCQECGKEIKQKESEHESLSFLHAEGLDADPAANTNSHKLKRLKLALAGFKAGEFSIPIYHAVVEQVLREAMAIQEILAYQGLKDVEAKIAGDIPDVMQDIRDHVDAFCQACQRMLRYDGQNEVSLAEEGLTMAEAAVRDMEETEAEIKEIKRAGGR